MPYWKATLPAALFGRDAEAKHDILEAYVHTYLQTEIQSEGIARNLGGFSRFLNFVTGIAPHRSDILY